MLHMQTMSARTLKPTGTAKATPPTLNRKPEQLFCCTKQFHWWKVLTFSYAYFRQIAFKCIYKRCNLTPLVLWPQCRYTNNHHDDLCTTNIRIWRHTFRCVPLCQLGLNLYFNFSNLMNCKTLLGRSPRTSLCVLPTNIYMHMDVEYSNQTTRNECRVSWNVCIL